MPQSVGLKTKGDVFTPLIERGTPLPAQCSEIFTTAEDYQTSIKITLLQGDHKRARRNQELGVFELTGIPPQLRNAPQILVAFDAHFSSIRVSAMDLRSGSAVPVTLAGSAG